MLRTWHGWLFILTALLMVVVMAATLRSAMVMEQSVQWVLHSDEIMARFLQLRATLSEAESNERAFLITGDKVGLQRFEAPRRKVHLQLEDLRLQTSDNDHQQELLKEVESLIETRFAQLDKVLSLKKSGAGWDEMVIPISEGSNTMQTLLQRMDKGLEAESQLFAEREAARRLQLRSMNITTVGSGVLALGTAVVGFALLRRSQKEAIRSATLETQKVRAERADHMKTRFLANMSHEIRTPMNAILGFTELLLEAPLSDRNRGYVESIKTSGRTLLELISDILDLSRLEAGRMPLNIQPVDLREVVESVRIVLSQSVHEKGTALECTVSADVPETLLLDGVRIRQVLLNLVSNAVKFTSEGRIKVEVAGEMASNGAPYFGLVMQVSDTGVGISPEDQERIFSAFEQAAASEAHAAKGTGLGLSITHRLVEIMGGTIVVASAPGEGSMFTVTLPRVPVGATPTRQKESLATNLNQLEPACILVVDDLASNREVIAGFFADTHHRLIFARDGMEALDQALAGRPDVILMDIRMPRMDGTWARQLLKDDPGTRDIPVIAQTASSMEGESERLKKFFDGYLRKPFSRRQLYKALSAHLKASADGADAASNEAETSLETMHSVTPEQVTQWTGLDIRLRGKEAALAARLSETLPMLEIAAFGRQLRVLADLADCDLLKQYVDTLLRAADAFDLETVEHQLKSFPRLLSRLTAATSSA